MTTTYIPGYIGTVTLDGIDQSATLGVHGTSEDVNVLRRPVLGQKTPPKGPGTRDIAFTASGFLVAEQAAALKALISQGTAIPCTIQWGEAGAATDAGQEAGNFVFSNVTWSGDADGDTTVELSAESDGPTTYTPPGP